MVLTVNGTELAVQWEQNETVDELFALAEKSYVTVNAAAYGGFEQLGSLPQTISLNDVRMSTEPGDIVLYSGDQIVLFFGSTSWNYVAGNAIAFDPYIHG